MAGYLFTSCSSCVHAVDRRLELRRAVRATTSAGSTTALGGFCGKCGLLDQVLPAGRYPVPAALTLERASLKRADGQAYTHWSK